MIQKLQVVKWETFSVRTCVVQEVQYIIISNTLTQLFYKELSKLKIY